jgi:hypothetical protein
MEVSDPTAGPATPEMSSAPSGRADIEALRIHAATLQAQADAAVRAYDRTNWIKLAAIFLPVPCFVALYRLRLEPWGYYVAGGALALIAATMVMLDRTAVARRDAAVRAAEVAQAACDAASPGSWGRSDPGA